MKSNVLGDKNSQREPETFIWAKKVKARDQKCTICDYIGQDLIAHHEQSWSDFMHPNDRYGGANIDDLTNGTTMCQQCHTLFHTVMGFGKNHFFQLKNFIEMRKFFINLLSKI